MALSNCKCSQLIKALHRRCLSTSRTQLSFYLQVYPVKNAKSKTQCNNTLGKTSVHWTTSFHHLAENTLLTLICHAAYITNLTARNFAKASGKVPALEIHLKEVEDFYINARLEKEKDRLKRKGVMKQLPIKVPEGVMTVRQL